MPLLTAQANHPAGAKGHAQVDKCEKSSDNAAMRDRLKIADAAPPKQVALYLAVDEAELETMKKVASGDASPAAARALIRGMMERVRRSAAETTRPAPVAALKIMTPTQRREALKQHYSQGKEYSPKDKNNWLNTKGKRRATPEMFLEWLNSRFPNRQEIGLRLSDLQHLDPAAYKKIDNWSRQASMKAVIESFEFPSKQIKSENPQRTATEILAAAASEFLAKPERTPADVIALNRATARALHYVNG